MKPEEIKTYSMHYACSNCHKDFMQSFEFGQRAYQGECPHCGVSPLNESRRDFESRYEV